MQSDRTRTTARTEHCAKCNCVLQVPRYIDMGTGETLCPKCGIEKFEPVLDDLLKQIANKDKVIQALWDALQYSGAYWSDHQIVDDERLDGFIKFANDESKTIEQFIEKLLEGKRE